MNGLSSEPEPERRLTNLQNHSRRGRENRILLCWLWLGDGWPLHLFWLDVLVFPILQGLSNWHAIPEQLTRASPIRTTQVKFRAGQYGVYTSFFISFLVLKPYYQPSRTRISINDHEEVRSSSYTASGTKVILISADPKMEF